jgi:subtilisin family serine protease
MSKIKLLFSIFILGLLLYGCTSNDLQSVAEKTNTGIAALVTNSDISNKYIVVMNEAVEQKTIGLQRRTANVKSKAKGMLKGIGVTGEPEDVYESALQGFTIRLTPAQAKELANDKSVKLVEPDGIMSVSPITVQGKTTTTSSGSKSQTTPWGITRVGGGTTTSTATAWVIDTGIDLTHPDLKVDATRSATFLGTGTTPNDQNGHGSHVSGIIAALNNTIGVVGVAPGTKLVSVRVLDMNGNGSTSGVIAGVNYVAANGKAGDVANMSLSGTASAALDQAVLTASATVKFVLAAGNNAANAGNYSPSRINGSNIYTVSAMDSSDKWASFSNFGNPPIDFCAPGVSIYSTYMNGGYATLSGTSMSAPHVTGLLLLGAVKTNGYVKNDPDGTADPIAHH